MSEQTAQHPGRALLLVLGAALGAVTLALFGVLFAFLADEDQGEVAVVGVSPVLIATPCVFTTIPGGTP